MRFRPLHRALLPLLAVLALAACHHKDEAAQVGGSTPEAALQGSIDLLKAGDFNGLWKHALPPADYAMVRADWSRHAAGQPPITPAERARFNEKMQTLTGPDAPARLYARLQPKLAAMERQYSDQLPVLVSIGGALAKRGVAGNKDLTQTQKDQLGRILDVLTPWARQAPWFDQGRAKQAIGVIVATARKLDLRSPDQLRAMDFDAAMKEYSLGFAGARQLLALYGLSVDDALNSARLTPVENTHGHAIVRIDYTLLGKPLSTESKLVEQDDRWYSEDLLDDVRAAHRQLGLPATGASAAAAADAAVAKD
ncbi:MAG: hypothetical protein KGJ97_02995 [Xanthomonadaceae bacterium]|nr:hypothetical protein [Xanthomonadaceae bacterium]